MTEFSDRTLEDTPERVTRFLSGLGSSAVIFTILHTRAGMEHSDVIEGKELLLAALGLPVVLTAVSDTEEAKAQRAATAELDAWDEPNFQRAQATLSRHFPLAGDYVFNDLSASQGPAAVKGVATFLARLDALESGSDAARSASKADDKKAVQLLAKRGFTKEERKRLAALVQTALASPSLLASQDTSELAAKRRVSLATLKAWFDEWSTSARAVLTKRSHLITLGLAYRRNSKPEVAEPAVDAPAGSGK